MRGRAAEIADAGALEWDVVWEALKTEPPADDPNTLAQELGLDEERDITLPDPIGGSATELSGTRHGRTVKLGLGVIPSGWRDRPVTEVHVESAVAPFHVSADDGRLVVEPGGLRRSRSSSPVSRRHPPCGATSWSRAGRTASSLAGRSQ
jgi:hypothetical protein